ncbi:unnamed protein product [Adineta steineri]|uniref:5'-nucleotidase n=1 Tax=Adineta steineri TaxID=433720 RepID=A0A819C1L8_9BILA|nr:unnamed protein product [Adineta steineri]CAF3803951.1 unnamed protein product [Adineta steineri]
MPDSFMLVICITSTALFDCSESHNIWKRDGLEAYKKHQLDRVMEPLKPGVGFRLVQSLLTLNSSADKELVEVVLVSRNDSKAGKRVRNSLNHYKLGITRMSFTAGTDVTTYLQAYGCDLFLTTEENQVRTVLSANAPSIFKGIAAGLLCNITAEQVDLPCDDSLSTVFQTTDVPNETMTVNASQWPKDQVRIVFDGDGVLFSDEAECVYKTKGLEAFRQSEHEKQHIALPEGPMHAFAFKLQKLREALGKDDKWRVRTFLVTARNGVANERAFRTLEQWGLEIDETHFLGGLNKTPFLIAIDPAIFFDDSSDHIDRAKQHVPAAHILYGIRNVIPDESTTTMITAISPVITTTIQE